MHVHSTDRQGHADLHRERLRSEGANLTTATIYRSTGSDGYTEGTWGWVLSVGGWSEPVQTFFDGGYESRDAVCRALSLRASRL